MTDHVLARVLALKTTPIPELKKLWNDLFDTAPPPYNRRFLENRLAYRLQELAYGGLKPGVAKRLERLGEQLDPGKKKSRRADERPIAGTRLIREWQGKPHEVIVQGDHFEYQGKRYNSLSSVARAITGTVWNGPMFFGLRAGKRSS